MNGISYVLNISRLSMIGLKKRKLSKPTLGLRNKISKNATEKKPPIIKRRYGGIMA
jgi:hypothetical protein